MTSSFKINWFYARVMGHSHLVVEYGTLKSSNHIHGSPIFEQSETDYSREIIAILINRFVLILIYEEENVHC